MRIDRLEEDGRDAKASPGDHLYLLPWRSTSKPATKWQPGFLVELLKTADSEMKERYAVKWEVT
jgi:hypothetical protein